MAELDVFSAVFVGAVTAFIGVITFLVYKLRILHKYIYKVGEFSVIFAGKYVNFTIRCTLVKSRNLFFEQMYHVTTILQYTFFLETTKKVKILNAIKSLRLCSFSCLVL